MPGEGLSPPRSQFLRAVPVLLHQGILLSLLRQTANSVVLNWAPSAGADHYEVQRKQNINSGWVTLSPNPSINSFPERREVRAHLRYHCDEVKFETAGECGDS
jgi:hypothetical protein